MFALKTINFPTVLENIGPHTKFAPLVVPRFVATVCPTIRRTFCQAKPGWRVAGGWRLAVGGWWLMAGSWRLVAGGRWLVAVGVARGCLVAGGWRLVAGPWWPVPGGWRGESKICRQMVRTRYADQNSRLNMHREAAGNICRQGGRRQATNSAHLLCRQNQPTKPARIICHNPSDDNIYRPKISHFEGRGIARAKPVDNKATDS